MSGGVGADGGAAAAEAVLSGGGDSDPSSDGGAVLRVTAPRYSTGMYTNMVRR